MHAARPQQLHVWLHLPPSLFVGAGTLTSFLSFRGVSLSETSLQPFSLRLLLHAKQVLRQQALFCRGHLKMLAIHEITVRRLSAKAMDDMLSTAIIDMCITM